MASMRAGIPRTAPTSAAGMFVVKSSAARCRMRVMRTASAWKRRHRRDAIDRPAILAQRQRRQSRRCIRCRYGVRDAENRTGFTVTELIEAPIRAVDVHAARAFDLTPEVAFAPNVGAAGNPISCVARRS